MKKFLFTMAVGACASAINAQEVAPQDTIKLNWDCQEIMAPAAGLTKTIYQIVSNYEGVMHIDCSAIKGATLTDLYLNGVRIGNVTTRDVLVQRHDEILFCIACQEDNSKNGIKLSYRPVSEGENWQSAVELHNADEIPVIKNNVDLAKWYKVTVPNGSKFTVNMPYCTAEVFTADNAASGMKGSSTENTETGVSYTYNNPSTRSLDLYIKVSANNTPGEVAFEYTAAETEPGDGSIDNPIVLPWDTESLDVPAGHTYYQVESNYEGVMHIDAEYASDYIAKLSINGKPCGNVVTRDVLVNRHDIITFDINVREAGNTIGLSYRPVAEGEIWNMPIAAGEEVEIPAIMENVDLAKWYKVTVPAGCAAVKVTTNGYATAQVFTAGNAAGEIRGSQFENTENGLQYIYVNNQDPNNKDLYIKVKSNNEPCLMNVEVFGDVQTGDGSIDNPYTLAWDTKPFEAPAGHTYYQMESNYEGVMHIDAEYASDYIAKLSINGKPCGNVVTRDVLVNRHDIITFDINAREAGNTIGLSYRPVAEGEIWNMPIAAGEEVEIPAIMENVDLAKWYKVTVPAGCAAVKVTTNGYATAQVFTAGNAAGEIRGSQFENTENGLQYIYVNNQDPNNKDLYIKVEANNEPCLLNVEVFGDVQTGDGSAENPYSLAWDTESFNVPAGHTYYQMTSNYEGVMIIDAEYPSDYIAKLSINGKPCGNVVDREVLINRSDVVLFDINTREDAEINISYRPVAEGDVWNMPIAAGEEVEIPAIKNNVDLAKWYKVTVPGGCAAVKVTTNGYATAQVFTADTAAGEIRGSQFENTENGLQYIYVNNQDPNNKDLYIKVESNNEPCLMNVEVFGDVQTGDGSAENPYSLAWDTESFNVPAGHTYYQMTSNYEGVMIIDAEYPSDYIAKLSINGKPCGNVVDREVLINRSDVVLFDINTREDAEINISYRPVAEGEIWNMPIAAGEEVEIPAIKNNVDLAKWYKVTVPGGCAAVKVTTNGYATAQVFTADTAAGEIRGSQFENTENGLQYIYVNNQDPNNKDLYIKVESNNEPCLMNVEVFGDVQTGDGSIDNPYILAWDTESIDAPAGHTYYQMESNYEGVMHIDAEYASDYIAKLSINGKPCGNVVTRDVLVNRHDIITFDINAREAGNSIDLSYRPVAEGEIWNMPLELGNGTEIPAIMENVDLAKWYKITCPPSCAMTIALPQGAAQVFTAENAAGEKRGSMFTNTENGTMEYTCNNTSDSPMDLYVKVSINNEAGEAAVTYGAPQQGSGAEDDPYILAWDTESFNTPAGHAYYLMNSNYEGVMIIDAEYPSDFIAKLSVNGIPCGNVVDREVLINRGDVVLFDLNTREGGKVNLSYRPVAEGDVWNMPIALSHGENEAEAVALHIDLADWYKVTVPANATLNVEMGQGIAQVFTADTAAGENMGSQFENTKDDTMTYAYVNNDNRLVDLYIKIDALNEPCDINVTYTRTIEDKSAYVAPTDEISYDDLFYTRKFNTTEWQPLYVPFTSDFSAWSEYVDIAKVTTDGIEDGVLIVTLLEEGEEVPANTPLFIRAKQLGEISINVKDATLEDAASNSVTSGNITITGTYEPVVVEPDTYYVLHEGRIVKTSNRNGYEIPAMRWYAETNEGDEIKLFAVAREDANSIAGLELVGAAKKVFSVSGAQVSDLQKGINIVRMSDGTVKKIIIK